MRLMEVGEQMDQDSTTRDVMRAMSGDGRALDRLWEQHRRWAAAVVLSHKPRDVDVEDLLQEIAMTVVRKIHDLRDPALFKPWLRTLAVNTARTAGRKRKVRLRLVRPEADPHLLDCEDTNAEDSARRAEGRRLLDLAHRLHPDYREPLLLRCVRGMTYKQISEVLELPVTTVETRIARARRMLREEVEFEEEATSMRVARGAANE